MESFGEEEEDRFFDAPEDIVGSISEANPDVIKILYPDSSLEGRDKGSFLFDVWNKTPRSVQERRKKFLKWMGLSLHRAGSDISVDVHSDLTEDEAEEDSIREYDGSVLRPKILEDEHTSSQFLMVRQSSCGPSDSSYLSNEQGSKNNSACIDGRMDEKMEEKGHFGATSERPEVGTRRSGAAEESENSPCSSPSFQQSIEMKAGRANNLVNQTKRLKKSWVDKLRSLACVFDNSGAGVKWIPEEDAIIESRIQRVKVNLCKKHSKELSALYTGQNIQAHEGAILTMKFSPDGQYLASGGEDGIVRLWQVMEDERSNETDIPEMDPSCIYFSVNHLSPLKSLVVAKEKMGYSTSLKKTSESACVILPPKVFRILEKPVHEFRGHSGEILDVSWSKNNYLLSSSVDETVRLWQVGHDDCLKVFPHSNYVTCVQFNPLDDNNFISGSIDGKVRIWGISSCHVVDWIDVREIVTAVCYRPNAEGVIVGSMDGNCRFYAVSENHLELEKQICLCSKKSPCKKITGFQFFPQDPSQVMVSCADSKIRILQEGNIVGKYKGLRNSGNQISASFTSEGKHIISASGDSNVYIWNCSNENDSSLSQPRKIRSYEHFSSNASIAIPWSGLRLRGLNEKLFSPSDSNLAENLHLDSPFSLSQEFILESLPKGSATWPEENLPISSPRGVPSKMHKSEYKFLKASIQGTSSSHAWGLVIVTAGWDGRIKSFHNYGLPIPV